MRGRGERVLRASLAFLTPQRLRWYPAVVLAVMLLALIVYVRFEPTFLGADFRAFYTAGTFVRTGRSELLYDIAAESRFQHELLGATGVSAWLSPPFLVWPFVALSHLPFFVAFVTHVSFGLAVGAFALTLLARELGMPRLRAMAWAAICYYPTLQWLADGQNSSLWAALMIAMFVMLRRRCDAAAGIALGCLILKPQLALGLVFALLGARRFTTLAVAGTVAGAWIGLGYLTLPSAMNDFFAHAAELGSLLRSDGYPTAGLRGIFQLGPLALDAYSRRVATLVGATLTVAALGTLFTMWGAIKWTPGSPSWDRRMAATIALAVLTSPHLFGYDLVLLLVPFFILWRQYPEGTNGRALDGGPLLVTTALLWALALVGPALSVVQQYVSRWAIQRASALQIDVLITLLWVRLVTQSTAVNASSNADREATRF